MSTDSKKKNILVIDDVSSIRAFIRILLEEQNYDVVEAENGAVGIDLYKTGNFDLVITDIYMPIRGGLEVVVELKRDYPNTKIIVLSDGGAENFTNNNELCEALGASQFLSKSKIKTELISVVTRVLEE